MTERLPSQISIGNKYGPAMEPMTQAEADAYFELLVEHCMRFGKTREEAEAVERTNLGYFAGYYNAETRARVERLFRCSHPVFGSIAQDGPPTAESALAAGIAFGRAARGDSDGDA